MFQRTISSAYKCYNFSNITISNSTKLLQNKKGVLYQATANMSGECKLVNYDDVLSATRNSSVYIIDVREPKELQESGEIPNSINIPLGEVENVLKSSSGEDFNRRFGRPKPDADTPIIFSCRSGKRAGIALDAALKLGFANSKSYEGSWLDWEERQKKKTNN